MKSKLITIPMALTLLISTAIFTTPIMAQGGFDEYGYNFQAMIFVGTGESWAMGKLGMTHDEAEAYMGIYAHDKLVMKWSKAWDDAVFGPDGIRENGDELPWNPDAWETNEWNGKIGKDSDGSVVDGSGEIWHYKIIWVGSDLEDSPYWREGGYPIWGQFEVIMSQGTVDNEHFWDVLATPNGFGGP